MRSVQWFPFSKVSFSPVSFSVWKYFFTKYWCARSHFFFLSFCLFLLLNTNLRWETICEKSPRIPKRERRRNMGVGWLCRSGCARSFSCMIRWTCVCVSVWVWVWVCCTLVADKERIQQLCYVKTLTLSLSFWQYSGKTLFPFEMLSYQKDKFTFFPTRCRARFRLQKHLNAVYMEGDRLRKLSQYFCRKVFLLNNFKTISNLRILNVFENMPKRIIWSTRKANAYASKYFIF